jgi:hypothetical protein
MTRPAQVDRFLTNPHGFRSSEWIWCPDFHGVTVASVPWRIAEGENKTLDRCFPAYDWVQSNGYGNLGSWAEAAAKAAGR